MFYFKDDKQITVYFSSGDVAVWQVDNKDFNRIITMCEANEWIKIETLHNQAKVIMTTDNVKVDQYGNLIINVENETVTLEASEEDSLLALIGILQKKGVLTSSIERVKPFLKNILENPYINASEELYEYLKNMDFEITEDGCFLAYKRVNKNLGSIYDGGKTKHVIGQYTEETNFDTNRNNDCSRGLHFCSKSYLSNYAGAKTIIVKVNPKDVVSIPKDYNFAKGRCCKYMTMGILAKDGTLQTTNIEALTGEKVVKSKIKTKNDVKASRTKTNRIDETVHYMKQFKDDINKVAEIMNISVETVKRNLRKYRSRG